MPRYLADFDSVPLSFTRGDGCFLYNNKDEQFLDFLGGWCVSTVGWHNAEMAEAISAQAKEGLYVPPIFRYTPQDDFAKTLCSLAPKKIQRVFRCTSGSEAVEFALKCARAATGKQTIVSIDGVYHGHTYGAASLGDACRKKMSPCLPGFIKLPMPKTKEEGENVANKFEEILKTHKDIAAFMSEPLWTNAGCYIPPEGFYQKIQSLCQKYNILFVMDEVATGFGRCGVMFASELFNLQPDIICLGKGFTGGYSTMGATMVTEKVFRGSLGIPDYSTFGWMPQDLAATQKNVEIIVRDNLVQNSAEVGEYLLSELKSIEGLFKVKEVRGQGLVFGIEFNLPIAPVIALSCYRKKLLVAFADAKNLFFSPPLILTKELAKQGADIIKKACGEKK